MTIAADDLGHEAADAEHRYRVIAARFKLADDECEHGRHPAEGPCVECSTAPATTTSPTTPPLPTVPAVRRRARGTYYPTPDEWRDLFAPRKEATPMQEDAHLESDYEDRYAIPDDADDDPDRYPDPSEVEADEYDYLMGGAA